MATCEVTLPIATLKDGTIDIVSKIKTLSSAALDTDSVYMRAKDTFKELFDSKQINVDTYSTVASQFISQLAVSTTQQVIQGAIQWATQEKELAYSLAQTEAQANLIVAQREQVRAEICKLEKEAELQCANITATLATSIRKNGRVATSSTDNPCIPLTLENEGSEYTQMKMLDAQKYSTLADAYRKSGIVQIGTDTDGMSKGTSGNESGYTNAQDKYARRQILSFEDSKRSHAANAVSGMIGQLLASEVVPAETYVQQWNTAVGYLNTNTPE